jgi:hypothetical protein
LGYLQSYLLYRDSIGAIAKILKPPPALCAPT